MSTRVTGSFTCADWKETVLAEPGDGTKLAGAVVANDFTGGIEATGTSCSYSIVYTGGASGPAGVFTGHHLLTGTVDGREGGFVLAERGTFDEKGTVRCAFEVVAGSGSGELAGLRGTGDYTAVQGEPSTAYTFDYDLG